jgi:hypothetical protein
MFLSRYVQIRFGLFPSQKCRQISQKSSSNLFSAEKILILRFCRGPICRPSKCWNSNCRLQNVDITNLHTYPNLTWQNLTLRGYHLHTRAGAPYPCGGLSGGVRLIFNVFSPFWLSATWTTVLLSRTLNMTPGRDIWSNSRSTSTPKLPTAQMSALSWQCRQAIHTCAYCLQIYITDPT